MEFSSGGYKVRPLHEFSFTADDGELVVLLGPSGCGKTTLLSCLAGLLTPTAGSISLDGKQVSGLSGAALSDYRRHTVGVVFQAFNLIPSLSARSNVMVPLRLAGVGRKPARERADALLEQVGLDERGHHRPDQMSGRPAAAGGHRPCPGAGSAAGAGRRAHRPSRLHPGRGGPAAPAGASPHPAAWSSWPPTTSGSPSWPTRSWNWSPTCPIRPGSRRPVTLAAGQVLFNQGDDSDLVYVVESGEVEIYRTGEDGTRNT